MTVREVQELGQKDPAKLTDYERQQLEKLNETAQKVLVYHQVHLGKILTVIGVIILLAIIGGAAGGGNKSTNNTNSSSSNNNSAKTESKPAMAKIGEAARDGKFGFVVKSMQCGIASVGDINKWKFYDPETKRRWIMYRTGTFIVDEALRQNPQLTIESLVALHPSRLLKEHHIHKPHTRLNNHRHY